METKETISKKLKAVKKLSGLNQNELADILRTTKQNISRWIKKVHLPDFQNIEAINHLYEQVTKEYGEIKEVEL